MSQSSINKMSLDGSWQGLWESVCSNLKTVLGEDVFNTWVLPLEIIEVNQGFVRLQAPTRFIRDWVTAHYNDQLIKECQKFLPAINMLNITVKPADAQVALSEAPSSPAQEAEDTSTTYGFLDKNIGATLDKRYTFENFIVGKPNELAYTAAMRVAESESVLFNPLFLYGGVGLGKTHLMHAIAWHIKKCHPKRRVIYLSAEKFMYQFIRALRYKDTVAFKEQFRSVDVLMIDDVQFISGKETTQEEFFHTFNALVDQNHQIIISADKSPSDLEGMEERMKSRLGWGLVADIHPTTYELRLGILQAKAESLNALIPKSVLEFLALRITSNVRELEGALNRIIAHTTLVGGGCHIRNHTRSFKRSFERF